MDFKRVIAKALKIDESQLEVPPDSKLGDYAFPCFSLSKKLKKNPVEIAKDYSKLKIKGVEVKATGPYLNFFVDKKMLAKDG